MHVCKFLRDLTIIQIRTVTAEGANFCSECICPTNVLHLKEGRRRKEGRKEGENLKERVKERRKENEGESEREGTATEREGESARLNTP